MFEDIMQIRHRLFLEIDGVGTKRLIQKCVSLAEMKTIVNK